MKATVIVAIYKDIEALDLILKSLSEQTYSGSYEIIVAEDGSDISVKEFIKNLPYNNILHTTQKDVGWQKNKSINNAIKISKGELLIFLDGDCIPYSNFIENYLLSAKPKTALAGRRVELGAQYSAKLRAKEISSKELEKNYFKHYFSLMRDNTRRYEEGIKFNKFFHKLKYKDKVSHILGCNFAVNRQDMLNINGFNEDYTSPSVGEDTDIEFRLIKTGCVIKPVRNLANVFHLFHESKYSSADHENSTKIYNKIKERNEFVCKNGIKKLD